MADLVEKVSGVEESAHTPAAVQTAARNARVGLVFFTIYLVIYCGYVGLAAFARSVMDMTPIAGLNVATLYGLALIVFALIFAVGYGWACRAAATAADSDQSAGSVGNTSSASSGRDA